DGAYTGTRTLLTEWNEQGRLAELRLVDVADTEATLAACDGADLVWLESPTNPMLALADIDAIAAGAHRLHATVVVDNTFATSVFQRPLELGADVVVHSATKFLGGHSDLLMGAAVTGDDGWFDGLVLARTYGGAVPGSLEAF